MTEQRHDRGNRLQQLFDTALVSNGGCRDWREWKAGETAAVIDLIKKAERMDLIGLDMEGDLQISYGIRMPIPLCPENGRLRVADAGVFLLRYIEEWRWESPPGWAPLSLWQPLAPFHPNCNVAPDLRGAICLGTLPAGARPSELIFLGYFALTLQDRNLNEVDPQGVMNPIACEYYRQHSEYLPLTRAGLLDPWEGVM